MNKILFSALTVAVFVSVVAFSGTVFAVQESHSFGNPDGDLSVYDPAIGDIVGYCADQATATHYCQTQGYQTATYGSRWLGPRLDNDTLYRWNGSSYSYVNGYACSSVINGLVCYRDTCTANSSQRCVGNSIYWFDSCGNQGGLVQTCTASQTCSNGSLRMGNDTSARSITDIRVNSALIDNNHTATTAGQITSFGYYASAIKPFSFVVVNASNVVQWVSPSIIPSVIGVNTYTPPSPVAVQPGYKAGLYFSSSGAIPFDRGGALFSQTPENSGMPAVGGTLNFDVNENRTYSFVAAMNGAPINGDFNPKCVDNATPTPTPTPHVNCNSNADCGTNTYTGSPFCQGNSVYQNYITYTCNNAGTASSSCSNSTAPQLKNSCSSTQNCQNGSCVNQNIACNSNADCGTDAYVGSPFCQGNNVYQNYITYTCNNAATPSSSCTNSTNSRLRTTCDSYQNCQNGSCGTSCTPNAYRRCNGNNVYWQDSCGNMGAFVEFCPYGCLNGSCINQQNYCTSHANQRCNGNSLYWMDSCGNPQELIQFCPNGCYNNVCQGYNPYPYPYPNQNTNFNITVQSRNLTSGSGWSTSTNANPGDVLLFMVSVQAIGNQPASNVLIRDNLPGRLIYQDNLVVSCSGNSNYNGYNNYNNNCNTNYNYSGNITSGINLNTIYPGQTVTVTYQAQVAGASNFQYGTTPLTDNLTITSSNSPVATGNGTIIVNRGAVYGASTISTGLTNNIWLDSFILPLMLALAGLYMWRVGMFVGIEKWLENKKAKFKNYKSERELVKRIAAIKKLG